MNSFPASLFLGWETSGGRERRVGPGLWVTHRRPGRYIAAMAPGLALRDGHRNQCSRGDKEGREGGSVAKQGEGMESFKARVNISEVLVWVS